VRGERTSARVLAVELPTTHELEPSRWPLERGDWRSCFAEIESVIDETRTRRRSPYLPKIAADETRVRQGFFTREEVEAVAATYGLLLVVGFVALLTLLLLGH
jgi:hypothetical protein